MALTLKHRGPDDGGSWADVAAGVALAHRRLSIVDLSSEGHQPMTSRDGRYVLVFNGEIYNYKDLSAELGTRGHVFRGHSDTEVMLAAFCEWGVENSLRRFTGMFAFAVWDADQRALHLTRDRMGEKPIYYGWCGTAFVFASELRALVTHPEWRGRVDPAALRNYLSAGYVLGDQSIFSGIMRLPPATHLVLSREGLTPGAGGIRRAYWMLADVAKFGASNPFRGSDEDAVSELDQLLRKVIGRQMVADVPVGAFLSGGIDSSTVVALMQASSRRPVKTFTIGFREAGFDESGFARQVSAHLGTEHTELFVSPDEARAIIPRLPQVYDEPFADESQIPTLLVSELARRHVTVSLSGDGGDELFGGYDRYAVARRIWGVLGKFPPGLRAVAGRLVRGVTPLVRGRNRRRMEWLGRSVDSKSREELYRRLMSHRANDGVMGTDLGPGAALFGATTEQWRSREYSEWMMYTDSVTYLPDDILVKVDRASMAVSLESRVPLLDHELVEWAWRLPMGVKVRAGRGKWVLRRLLHRYVPVGLVDRPKMGFGVPMAAWLRGPLRDWSEGLLDPARLKREGFLDAALVRRNWEDHLSGRRNLQYALWAALMFQAWREIWRPSGLGE
jgi:asparagine synthase (glutamine-hydrolysing)